MKTTLAILLCFLTVLPASAQRFVKIAGNTNELLAMPVPDTHSVTLLKGLVSSNENLALLFQYIKTSTTAPNGINVFRPTFGGGVGRYHLLSVSVTNTIPRIASSTDNALVRWDGTNGMVLQDSVVILTDTGALSGLTSLAVSGGVTNTGLTASQLVFTDANKRLISGAIGAGLSYDGVTLTASGTGLGTVTSVAATAPASGFTISGSPITTAGTFVFTLADDLAALEGLSATGIPQRTAANTWQTTLGTSNYLPKWSATAPFLTTTSLVYDNGTNVGIGTANPQDRFVVDVSPTAGGNLTVFGTNNRAQLFLGNHSGAVEGKRLMLMYDFPNNKSSFNSYDSLGVAYTRMDIDASVLMLNSDSAGLVGIGTASPVQRLSVNGGISLVGLLTNTTGVLTIGAQGGLIQMDQNVQVGIDTGSGTILGINSAAGTTRDLLYRSGSVRRWALRANATAEAGTTSGSDFEIIPSDDAGAALAAAVTITRSSGNISIPGSITNGALTATSAVFSDANKRLVSTGLVTIAQGGTGVALTDPGADKLFGWDDTGNTLQFFNIGAGLVYNAATDTLSSTNTGAGGGDFVGPASATDTAIVLFDGTTGKLGKNSVGLLSAGGALTGISTLNTGQGAYELYAMNQNVRTSDGPSFTSLGLLGVSAQIVGQGSIELLPFPSSDLIFNPEGLGYISAQSAMSVDGGLTNATLTASSPVFTDANKQLVSTGLVALAQGGTANALADPASNRLMGWDDTDNLVKFLIIGAGLNYNAATDTLTATTTGGDVVGPGAATDEALARFDGTTGKLIQNSAVTLSDAGAIAGVSTLNTGQGAFELYGMNQNVRTTDSPLFGGILVAGANAVIGSSPFAETGYAVTQLGNAAVTRRLETVYVGTGAASIYGIPAGGVGINALATSMTFSTADLSRMVIGLDGSISMAGALTVSGGVTNAALTANTIIGADANKRLKSVSLSGLTFDGTTLTATSAGTVTSVAATQPAAGLTIGGSPITGAGTFAFTLADDLAALEGIGTTGIAQRTAANTWSTISTVPLSQGGTATALADPNANRVMGWDDTENLVKFFTIGTGLSYDQATDTLSASGGSGSPAGPALSVQYNDGAGLFAGSAGMTWGEATYALQLGTTIFPGILRLGNQSALHVYSGGGTSNSQVFVGPSAGNFTMGVASFNTSVGASSMTSLTTGSFNSGFGYGNSISITNGSRNSVFGYGSGDGIGNGADNVILGYATDTSASTGTNQIVIGSGVTGIANNTATVGGTGAMGVVLNVNAGQATAMRAKVGGTIWHYASATGTSNTANVQSTLIAVTIPGNTFAADGDGVDFWGHGRFATNSNTKMLRIFFGGGSAVTTTGTTQSGGRWAVNGHIIRASTTNVLVNAVWSQGTNSYTIDSLTSFNPANDNVVEINAGSESTANGDVILTASKGIWQPGQ